MARTDRQPRQRLDADTRRHEILLAAAASFGALAYDRVSVAAVASAAGASEALVFRYFGNKAELYVAVLQAAVDELMTRQVAALAALPDNAPARERVKSSIEVYLDHIAASPVGWAAPFVVGNEPGPALAARRRFRAEYVERLRELLLPDQGVRHEFALWGYFGFLDAACLAWAENGCSPDARNPLIEAALGALEGALGDWGR